MRNAAAKPFNGKKLMETAILLIKIDSTFHTGKPGNFNSLREDNII